MGYIKSSGAALACAVVAGATIAAAPAERPTSLTGEPAVSPLVDLTSSARALSPWPQLRTPDTGSQRSVGVVTVTPTATDAQDSTPAADNNGAVIRLTASPRTRASAAALIAPDGSSPSSNADAPAVAAQDGATTADEIDDSFIDFTIAVRTDITPVLNRLGYLGKQIYVGVNFLESIAASVVFNSTDILRGEDFFTNLGDIALDVAGSAFFVVIDEAALASPFTFPIAISRPPEDRPGRWRDAIQPLPDSPLTVPNRDRPASATALDGDVAESTDTDDVVAEGASKGDQSRGTAKISAEDDSDANAGTSKQDDANGSPKDPAASHEAKNKKSKGDGQQPGNENSSPAQGSDQSKTYSNTGAKDSKASKDSGEK